eukprot:CAMPEP_0184121594 /NCGR_PEP_ID=MMETSP0974-20121125/23052_1 /TAXON_ID=483370 /ORGANISM="non described non described, Strain CCMP2097" /LENGTH=88 /DNA_ID=CAMNT_0026424805 /DNA_START=59 /DNA_END=323 /DNA_ORIENTATION=+
MPGGARFDQTSGETWWYTERRADAAAPDADLSVDWALDLSAVRTRGFAVCVASLCLAQLIVAAASSGGGDDGAAPRGGGPGAGAHGPP